MQTDLKEVTVFAYQPYLDGFILRFPTLLSPTAVPEWSDDPEQLDMIREYGEWAEIVGVDNVAKLNHMIFRRQLNDLKWPGEGLHQRKITKIAQALVKNFATQRIITISGPSSSNKTTFAKRLGIALRVKGHRSLIIEMDDFFVNAADTPLGADGKKDFEAFTAVNLPLLQERVEKLLKGESVPRRKYQFKKGQGIDIESERLTLHPDMFLILEGIHGLNPILLDHLGRDRVAPIYVAALAPLAIDDTHRFPSSDLRLLRRITRDFAYRGRSARKTLLLWTSVRIGEERNIRPYRGNALYFFNSSLVYEVPVLSVCVRSLLAEATVPEPDEDLNDPITIEITREARRLLALIKPFYAISLEEVPHISCIREFCGGSDLDY
jgi:uridine kinase